MSNKKAYFLFVVLILFYFGSKAQNYERGFNFQGIAYNTTGEIYSNTSLDINVSIYPEGDSGNVLYSEGHTVTTQETGYFQIVIGSIDEAAFGAVEFSAYDCRIKIEARADDQAYHTITEMEMLSVPYAKVADVCSNGVPVGFILPFTGPKENIPNGWLYCNGDEYATTGDYALLFATIGYAWGGSGGTFRLPDLRGQFLRGVDDSKGQDPSAADRTAANPGGNTGDRVGTKQGADNLHQHAVALSLTTSSAGGHTHSYDDSYNTTIPDAADDTNNSLQYANISANGTTDAKGSHSHSLTVNGNTGTTGNNELRPINASVIYIIKYN